MKKPELLVPAGNMECLYQAVLNGCDAVYLACKAFGARKFATNFTNEEIIEAISFCHLYGVRIYVTMNTLVKNHEVNAFIEQVSFLHKHGVDALIVQDFGMICLLREKFPNLEIHASTQANISSFDICRFYHNIGVKRVVFSRELSIDEIDSIDVDIEKEVFIHGALCISYSGCCLMSSMLGGRSGNRGECAGVCRMPFSLMKNKDCIVKNKYLLSTKELNTSHNIKRLLDSTIDSFKIEGRMKGPLYVGFITRFYRKMIDGEPFSIEDEKHLKIIFNRDFTKGRLFHESDFNLMNINSPNHIGLEIGKVVSITKNRIKIQINPSFSLHQGDAIRFMKSQKGFIVNYLYDEKGNLTSSSSNICYVDNKIQLKELDVISKTQDILLEKELKETEGRKIPISFIISAQVNKPFKVKIGDGDNFFEEEFDIVKEALKTPITRENIVRQLSKLGDTPFVCENFNIQMDEQIFLPMSCLNEARRILVNKLIEARCFSKKEYIEKDIIFEANKGDMFSSRKRIHCYVSNEEQLKECLKHDIDAIYVSDENLYSKYRGNVNVYYMLPKCILHPLKSCKERNVVSDYADYSKIDAIGSYGLNVMNIYTAYYLNKIGLSKICLSVELTELECQEFMKQYMDKFGKIDMIAFVYGRVQNMIIKGNILNIDFNNSQYTLQDTKGRNFPVFYDGRLTHVLNCDKRFFNNLSREFIHRYDFYEETAKEIDIILQSL